MNISVQLFAVKWKMILSAMVVLLAGKLAVMVAAGQMFGLSRLASLRAGGDPLPPQPAQGSQLASHKLTQHVSCSPAAACVLAPWGHCFQAHDIPGGDRLVSC